MPEHDRRGQAEARSRRYEDLLDGRIETGALGSVLDVARTIGAPTIPPGSAAVDRGLEAALSEYRATTAHEAVPTRWRRRRSKAVRGVATATLTTKILVGTVAAAAVGGITVVTVERVRPGPPAHRPARTSAHPSGSGRQQSSAPPSDGSFAPLPSATGSPSRGRSSGSPTSSGPTSGTSSPAGLPTTLSPSGLPTGPTTRTVTRTTTRTPPSAPPTTRTNTRTNTHTPSTARPSRGASISSQPRR